MTFSISIDKLQITKDNFEGEQITLKRSALDFKDLNGKVIVLTDHYYRHIINVRGSKFISKYRKYISTLLVTPDIIGESAKHNDCTVYILKSKNNRKFEAKYLILVVNGQNLITSMRLSRTLKGFKKLKETND